MKDKLYKLKHPIYCLINENTLVDVKLEFQKHYILIHNIGYPVRGGVSIGYMQLYLHNEFNDTNYCITVSDEIYKLLCELIEE